ncbi:MAG: hypothetical protein OEL53_00620 [Rhodospirillales bacterium]|nr:hypothetical protein [Rhodospirillales bacterium]
MPSTKLSSLETSPELTFLSAKVSEAIEANALDSRYAKTERELGIVAGQRQLLDVFAAWLNVATSSRKHGRSGRAKRQ